jgi:trimeric autotransporter adhesin
VSEELGLEDPKDLRAEIGKCPNSTNERKNMSTKTIYKRIALVAVAALGAGVLSVAPASAVLAADDIIIHPTVTTLGSAINRVGDICSITNSATTQSATIPVSSTGLTLTSKNAATTDAAYLTLSGPGRLVALNVASNEWVNESPTTAIAGSLTGSSATADDINVVPTGVGTITITLSATAVSAALDVITVNVVAVCGGGTYSLAAGDNSYVIVDTTADESDETLPTGDVLNADVVTSAGTGLIRFSNKDEYGAAPSDKALISTVSGANCLIGLAASSSSAATYPTAGAVTAVAASSTTTDWIIAVKQASSGTPATCAVSTSWNGVPIGTKTIKFQGAPAKITVSDVTVGYTGGSGYLRATVTDAAGNALASKTVTASATEANNAASSSVVTVSSMTATTAAVTGKTPAIGSSPLTYTCTAKGGAAKLTVRTIASGVTYITSAPFDVFCGEENVDTFTLSMDKATYAPGEIATLTVSAKGAYGSAVHTLATVGADVAAGFGGMEFVTAPTSSDKFSSGVGTRTYTLKVGTTEGAFVGTFKMTAGTDTAAKTVQYKIANAAGTVSNADVLKAIVSLIASINKQIAALQKALLRR